MKFKSVMLLGVAVACGLIAMLGVQQVMSSPTETEEAPEESQVLVATTDIEPFAPLDESNTTFKSMPLKEVPAGAILTREECADRTLKYGVVENDVILSTKLTEPNHKPSREIPKGMRLVTVKVNQTKTHSGLIRPGDFVDVMLTYKFREANKQPVQRSLVVLQNVKVFATDNRRRINEKEGGDMNTKNMSLVVTPEDGNLLILAESKGQLTMALRNEDEPVTEGMKPITEEVFNELLAKKDSSALSRQEEEEDAPPAVQQNFSQFLAGDPTAGQLGENNDGETVLSSRETWKITIFDGTEPRVEEVGLPGQPSLPRADERKTKKKSTKSKTRNTKLNQPRRKDEVRRKQTPSTKPASI